MMPAEAEATTGPLLASRISARTTGLRAVTASTCPDVLADCVGLRSAATRTLVCGAADAPMKGIKASPRKVRITARDPGLITLDRPPRGRPYAWSVEATFTKLLSAYMESLRGRFLSRHC